MLVNKRVGLTGAAFIFIALFHIPDFVFKHSFDKDAPAQFISIASVSTIFLIYMLLKPQAFHFHKKVVQVVLALAGALFMSALLSGNIVGAIFGDTGRFVGVLSALSLLVVAGFHAQFSIKEFLVLLKIYLIGVELVVLGGLLEHFNVIDFPGDLGVASTLGNADFFAAFVATSFPLFFLLSLKSSRKMQYVIGVANAVNIVTLYFAGPLQAWVDVAFTVLGIAIYLLRGKLPRRDISLNKRTYLATLGVVIWAEFIFLMPFLGSAIPVLGNDIQVKIRANFWIDGIRQFFSHPLFGVGPDQYGNYYEKYRTITDVQKYPNVLSNDAHSAAVQTLATLGIVGSVLYLVLIAIVIRSLLILWDNRVIERKIVFALALYLAVYLTNSFISPITPSHKYLMWAVCGFIVGRVYINNESKSKITAKFAYAITAVALISCIATFSAAQISYLTAVEDFSRHQDQKSSYQTNPAIPCFMYFDAEFYMLKNNGPQAPLELANEKLKANPRCVAALIAIAQAAANSDDQETLGLYVSQLNEVAPYRSTTLSLSMFYASRTGNKEMAVALQKRMNELGLVYIPGKLG